MLSNNILSLGGVVSEVTTPTSVFEEVVVEAIDLLGSTTLFRLLRKIVIIIVITGVITKLRKKYPQKLLPFFLAINPGINAHKAIPIIGVQFIRVSSILLLCHI